MGVKVHLSKHRVTASDQRGHTHTHVCTGTQAGTSPRHTSCHKGADETCFTSSQGGRRGPHRDAPAWDPPPLTLYPAFSRGRRTSGGSPTRPCTLTGVQSPCGRDNRRTHSGGPQAGGGEDGGVQPCRWVHTLQMPGRAHTPTQDGSLAGQQAGRSVQRGQVRAGCLGLGGWGTWAGRARRGFLGGPQHKRHSQRGGRWAEGWPAERGPLGTEPGARRKKQAGSPASPGASRAPVAGTCPSTATAASVPGSPHCTQDVVAHASGSPSAVREQPPPGTCCRQSLGTHPDLHIGNSGGGPRGLLFPSFLNESAAWGQDMPSSLVVQTPHASLVREPKSHTLCDGVAKGNYRSAADSPYSVVFRCTPQRSSIFTDYIPHKPCPPHAYSVVSDSSPPHWLQPTRLLCSWDFPARILDWGAISSSRGSSRPRD